MDKNILRFKEIIENTKNINACIKALNLDMSSCFLCFLTLISDAIVNYDSNSDYNYLLKVSNYLERVYQKLTIKEKKDHKKEIILIRKICKKNIQNFDKKDRNIFEKIVINLSILDIDKKEDNNDPIEDDFSDLLYDVIFSFKNLEYLDKIIEKNPYVLNSSINDDLIFELVINEYLKSINNIQFFKNYYERVINKFLLEKSFQLNDGLKDKIIKKIANYLSTSDLDIEKIKTLKKLIECLRARGNTISLFNIKDIEPKLSKSDRMSLESVNQTYNNRIKIDGYIATIDSDDSKVLDDAISEIKVLPNGNLLYMVHIADPFSLLSYDSDTIQEAKRRTTTIYLDDTNIPMINKSLGEDKLSLVKGLLRPTKTFCIEFDKDFNVLNFNIINSVINVTERLSYDKLNEIYRLGSSKKEEAERIENYDKLIIYLKHMFKDAKLYEKVKPISIIGNTNNMDSFSENLVSYSMLLVGYLTALYFDTHKLPYAYRCHKYDKEWISFLEKSFYSMNSKSKKVLNGMKGEMPKSYYSRLNEGHMGLNLSCYSHVTSPLRRFADDLNMLAIDTCYFKTPSDKEIYKLEQEIDNSCRYINMQSNTIDECINKKLIK